MRARTRDGLVVLAFGAVLAVVVALHHRGSEFDVPASGSGSAEHEDPDRQVLVSGRIVDGSGAPVAGITVLAHRAGDVPDPASQPDAPNVSDPNGRFMTLAPLDKVTIVPVDPGHHLCGPSRAQTITGPLDIGDVVMSPCP